MAQELKLTDVFGMSAHILQSYVERDVDAEFRSALHGGRHIVVYGSSKQGKTSLKKRHLKADDAISISCQTGWKTSNLYLSILKEAGYEAKVSSEKTVSGGFKISALSISGKTSAKSKPLEIDTDDPNDVIRALTDAGFSKRIVLDDYHYLPKETQDKFAFALKVFFEKSDIRFVIIAVWRERNRVSAVADLAGRYIPIDADNWSDRELKSVIELGSEKLNINFPQSLQKNLSTGAQGSVYIVQEVCRKLCERAGVFSKCAKNTRVGHGVRVTPLINEVLDQQSGIYRTFISRFAQGFSKTQLEMYKWIIWTVVEADYDALRRGLPLAEICESIKSAHPNKKLQVASITQALQSLASLQSQQGITPFVLDYDDAARVLHVVDRGFPLWLANQDKPTLLSDVGVAQ